MIHEHDAKIAELEAQVAQLTRRVYALEQARPLPSPPLLNQQPTSPPEAIPLEPTPVEPIPPPIGETEVPTQDWEGQFSTHWLSRAGVFLIVIGVVLFLGYAMTEMSAAGRVAVATVAGLAMLGAGYRAEALGNWRPWSLVMVAGGFAVLYATAYAAHAVPAAQVIPRQELGVLLQTAIAVAAVREAVRLGSERAAAVGFLAAFLGILSSDSSTLRFWGSLPLTLGGLALAVRMQWPNLPWGIFVYSWLTGLAVADDLAEQRDWGQPVSWFYWALFSGYEIWLRTRGQQLLPPLWLALNAGAFLLVSLVATTFPGDTHSWRILGLFTLAGLVPALVRRFLNVRHEALGEALVAAGAALWLMHHYDGNSLLGIPLVLGLALLALFLNKLSPTLALTVTGELLLGFAAVAMLLVFPDSKLLSREPLRWRLAFPQTLLTVACLFLAGRFLTVTPWPSWLALAGLAELTLLTVPETLGTILLALEAIAAVAVGLYLNRRPLRLGGLALFAFSILKVFFYDLSELDTLPRIFSFLVLGALLLGASWGYTRYRRELQKYL
ncbi:MAG: DUF2339 domain-containing protein [Bryobacter sp.]|nr:DUF2339 domain-containing protein [Bryobacter sp.]